MNTKTSPRIIFVQVVYNSRQFIEPVFSAMFAQTVKNFHVVAVIAGNDDGSKELIAEKFPQVEIIDPGYNIGFAKGHNLIFSKYQDADYFQLVNPDLVMKPDYVEKLVDAMEKDKAIGAVTGKLYQVDRAEIPNLKSPISNILDSTGVVIYKSGSARDRGQHEVDNGQYDGLTLVDAVSAAGCMYRSEALKFTKLRKIGKSENRKSDIPTSDLSDQSEYFDEDFHSYWEDVDLAWRMKNAGWKNVFVPEAVAYHGRGAGSREGGYWNVLAYIKHHHKINPRIRQLNYKNHIWMYIKNSKWFYPQFFVREFFMLGYIVLFEIGTLKVFPEILKMLPKMWQKRKILQMKFASRN